MTLTDSQIDGYLAYLLYVRNHSRRTADAVELTLRLFLRENPVASFADAGKTEVEDWLIRGRAERQWKPSTYIAHHKHFS